eukprot:gene1385-21898_t
MAEPVPRQHRPAATGALVPYWINFGVYALRRGTWARRLVERCAEMDAAISWNTSTALSQLNYNTVLWNDTRRG